MSDESNPQSTPVAARGGRARVLLGAVLVLIVFGAVVPARWYRPGVSFGIAENVQIAEAQAWWQGRLDLPERKWDTALKDGRVYSYFPPMFTMLSACVVPFCGGVPHWFVAGFVLLVPLAAYRLFLMLTSSVVWAVILSLGLTCGTSMLPVASSAVSGAKPYSINHSLAVLGLLFVLIDLLGSRRMRLACLGLFVAALSRQLTIVFAIPIVIAAWYGRDVSHRARRLVLVGLTCLVVVGLYGGLNQAKFGHPLRTGYMLNHAGRDDVFAREARAHGLLSLHWVPRNLYYMNIGLPRLHRIEVAGAPEWYLRPNTMGTGIWWTTPILCWVFFCVRDVRSDRVKRALLGASGLLFGLLMLWHATGAVQRGFNRYSLDFLPVLIALIVPTCLSGRRRWLTLAMLAWGVAYFRTVPFVPPLRIW